MLKENELVGAIIIYRQEVRPFTDRQVELVRSFASQAVIAIENTRLLKELRESLQQQTATADVLKVISRSTFDLPPVLDTLISSACRLCEADLGAVRYQDGSTYRVAADYGSTPGWRDHLARQPAEPDRGSIFGRTVVDGRTIHIPDVLADPEYTRLATQKLMGYRAALGVPLIREGRVFGVLNLFRFAPRSFTEKQIELVETFADQAVIAIENTRLFNETKETLERQTATADILKVIASSPSDVQPVFEAIASSANRLIGGLSTAVYSLIDDMQHLSAFTPTNAAADAALQALFPRPLSMQPWPEQTRNGEIVHVPDIEADPAVPEKWLDVWRMRGFRGFVRVPLRRDRVTVGMISVTRAEPGPFAAHHIQLLQTFADQAIIAIENAQLFDEVQTRTRDLTMSLQQQTATADVLKVISRSAFDLQAVLDTLISSAVELIGAIDGAIFLRGEDGYRYRAGAGIESEMIRFLASHPPTAGRHSAAGRVILYGDVQTITDVLDDPDYALPAFELNKTRSLLGVPLLRDDKIEGGIVLSRTEAGPFTKGQIELVQTFADQAVIAIENVRLFDEVQAKTRDLSEALIYQTGSGNILRVIASSPTDVGPVLRAIVESACELCDAVDAIVLLEDGDGLRASAHHGPIPVDIERWSISRKWVSGRSFLDQRPVHVHDLLSAEGDEFPDTRQRTAPTGTRSILSVPLLREGKSVGTIVLRRTEVHPFSDKQIALLQTFADQAVIAIGNVHMFEQVQARTRDLSEVVIRLGASSISFWCRR